jgi:GDPmannose 4,6-dehydratase
MLPVSPYAAAKLYAYYLTRVYRVSKNLFTANGILFNHESPRRGMNFVTAKVVKGALDIKFGKRDKLKLGNLESTRDWGHAKDYVYAMWLMLQHKEPDDFVVATGKEKSVRDLCKYVFEKIGIGDYRKYVITDSKYIRPYELNHLRGDPSKIRKTLNWSPKYSFELLLDEMIIEIEKRFFIV